MALNVLELHDGVVDEPADLVLRGPLRGAPAIAALPRDRGVQRSRVVVPGNLQRLTDAYQRRFARNRPARIDEDAERALVGAGDDVEDYRGRQDGPDSGLIGRSRVVAAKDVAGNVMEGVAESRALLDAFEAVSAKFAEVTDDDGTKARIICGELWGASGPVDGIAAEPSYVDIAVPPGRRKTIRVDVMRHAFAYVFDGSGTFKDASSPRRVATDVMGSTASGIDDPVGNRSLVLFDRGDSITVQAGDEGLRFLLVSGQPLEEPVAWYGPIVMNTKDELQRAMAELGDGTFIKHG